MKFRSLSVILLILSPLVLLAQNCLPDGITFTRQSQLDSFPILYPTCTHITGTIEIDGSQDTITSLAGLNQVTHVVSSFRIHQTDLVSLEGLSFDTIEGELEIYNNFHLENLHGLEALTYVASDVSVRNNPYLSALSGLDNLVAIGGKLDIQSQSSLGDLQGLSSLTAIQSVFQIANNSHIKNLHGLQSLVEVGHLYLSDNSQLLSLDGLQSLSTIHTNLFINNCDSLSDIRALINVHDINGFIYITRNNLLTSLAGLDNLCDYAAEFVTLVDNPNLATCSVPCICEHFQHNATGYVHDNSTGCNSMTEIKDACLVDTDPVDPYEPLVIQPNPASDVLFITGMESSIRYKLYDSAGQLLQSDVTVGGMISLTRLAPGVFYIRINGEQSAKPYRVVKI